MLNVSKKSLILIIAAVLLSTSVYAIPQDFFNLAKERLLSIASEFTEKESSLVEDGDSAQKELNNAIISIEEEIRQEVSEYEQKQIEAASQALNYRVDELISQLEAEKGNIKDEIKEKIKEKIDKDLEKELKKLENMLKN